MSGPVLSIVMPFSAEHARGKREIEIALAALMVIDMYEIREYALPALYSSGVRYAREVCLAPGVRETCERFLSARKALEERTADCDDLAAWRSAELRVSGEDPGAAPFCRRSEAGWHCLVRRSDGTIEDPSVVLGMRG